MVTVVRKERQHVAGAQPDTTSASRLQLTRSPCPAGPVGADATECWRHAVSERPPTAASLTRRAAAKIQDGDVDDGRLVLAEALATDPEIMNRPGFGSPLLRGTTPNAASASSRPQPPIPSPKRSNSSPACGTLRPASRRRSPTSSRRHRQAYRHHRHPGSHPPLGTGLAATASSVLVRSSSDW